MHPSSCNTPVILIRINNLVVIIIIFLLLIIIIIILFLLTTIIIILFLLIISTVIKMEIIAQDHDIAIIQLSQPVQFSDSVAPVLFIFIITNIIIMLRNQHQF